MNKLIQFSLILFYSTVSSFSMEKPASISPEDIFRTLRIVNADDFKKAIKLISTDQLQNMRIQNNLNIFHILAFPLSDEEIRYKSDTEKKSYSRAHMARLQAIKADLLLKKIGANLLKEKTKEGDTPGMVAAKTSNLRVLARFVLTKSPDELDAIAHLASNCVKRIHSDCMQLMMVKHLYPRIRQDLQVNLTIPELARVYEACESGKNPELSPTQIQYMFEAFLTFDIFKQYEENRTDKRVMAFYDSLMSKSIAS